MYISFFMVTGIISVVIICRYMVAKSDIKNKRIKGISTIVPDVGVLIMDLILLAEFVWGVVNIQLIYM